MKKNSASQSGLFNPRILVALALCSVGVFLTMLSFAASPPNRTPGSSGSPPPDSSFVNNHAGPLISNATATAVSGPTFGSAGSLTTARYSHTATLLANGKTLFAGGVDSSNHVTATAELYDPAAGTWIPTGSLATARGVHTATLLPNGKVLVAAGGDNSGSLASAELYDPAAGTWTPTGSLATAHRLPTATLLANGKVLVAGGLDSSSNPIASAELYDPAAGTWTPAGSLATARYHHTATLLANGKVLVAGGFGNSDYLASAELYDPATGTWTTTSLMTTARQYHTATLLPNGRVLVGGGVGANGPLTSAELYDPAGNGGLGSWSQTGRLATGRELHTATLLPNGTVLVTGGYNNGFLASAELYDPTSNGGSPWTTTSSSLATGRFEHTATLLANGKVLVAGGFGPSGALASAKLYDPAGNGGTASWAATGSLGTGRSSHTATLLVTGKVLVTGGLGGLASAELYDPAGNNEQGSWATTGSLATARSSHTATLLPNGKVLVAGGLGISGPLASTELYDPATGLWTTTGNLATARSSHTATLLPNGKVLVAGGLGISGPLASTELYDPATGLWTTTGNLATARSSHSATLLFNGNVLVAGGLGISGPLASAELYDPAGNGGLGSWATTGSLATARQFHTAILLRNGKVLVAGGLNSSLSASATAELYDPTGNGGQGSWTTTGNLATARQSHMANLLANGQVLVAGGLDSSSNPIASAELYDPTAGSWTTTGSLAAARSSHTATLLPNGKVLVAGGLGTTGALASAEVYSAVGTWAPTGSLATGRVEHTATLLPNGKVLVAGGDSNPASAELYDPATGLWTTTGSLATGRIAHTATLLPNGKVLAAGGDNGSSDLASAELYDPATGLWTTTGSLATARSFHSATLLFNGKVLVAGGDSNGNATVGAELYDPAGNGGQGSWTTTGSLATARDIHTATLLPNGKVLVAGGHNFVNSGTALASAELYDPAGNGGLGSWSQTGSLATARFYPTATLLPNGKVLVAGGANFVSGHLASAELYDPATASWTPAGSLATAREVHAATLLPNGKVLVAGGETNVASAELYDPAGNGGLGLWTTTGSLAAGGGFLTATLLPNGKVLVAGGETNPASSELYDIGLGFNAAWQPQLTSVTSSLSLSTSLTVTGSRFQGVSGASGGNVQDSSTNYPLVQLRSLGNEQTAFLLSDPTTNWSNTSFTSSAVTGLPPGYTLVTVFTNAIPSNSRIVQIIAPQVGLTSVVSRKVHGTVGTFDINLPLTGTRGIECRSSASLGTDNYTLVFTFTNNLTSVASATVTSHDPATGTGSVSGNGIGPNPNQYTVNLTGVSTGQYITVTLNSVLDATGASGNVLSPQMGVLVGDVNANGVVSNADVSLVKAQVAAGASVDSSNFQDDINANGVLTNADVSLTKAQVAAGAQLLSPP